MAQITVAAGTISAPMLVPPSALVTVTPDVGAYTVIEYSTDNAAAVANGVATWYRRARGDALAASVFHVSDPAFLRFTPIGGGTTINLDLNPSASAMSGYHSARSANGSNKVLPAGQALMELPEGQALTITGAAGTAGVAYLLDPVLGGTNSLRSWAIGAGSFTTPAYAGTQQFLISCSAGSVDVSVGAAVLGVAATIFDTPKFAPPRSLKRMLDLGNVVLSKQPSAAYTATIDANSPFGRPALKLVITSTVDSDYVNIRFSNLDIPFFDDHVAARIFIDDTSAVQNIRFKIGDSGFAHANDYMETISDNGIKVGGARTMAAGPNRTVGANSFVFGTHSLQDVMLTAYLYANRTTTIWIDEIFIPQRQRAILCMTWDDNYANWPTEVLPLLTQFGFKATFAFNSSNLNADGSSTGPAFIDAAGLNALYAAGHQICSHCVNNYKLQTISPNPAFGVDNGTIPASSLSTLQYVADYLTAANKETKFALPAAQQNYHAWVQGGVETAAVEMLQGYGVNLARITAPYETNVYGFDMTGANAMTLRATPFGSSYDLAALTQRLADTVKYGGLMVTMGHDTQATSSDSITISRTILAGFMAAAAPYVAAGQLEVMRMIDLEQRLRALGLLTSRQVIGAKRPVRCIGRLKAANFNTTTDQAITLDNGTGQAYKVTGIRVGRGTGSTIALSSAVGGVYTAAAKGGTAIVAASQTYAASTTSTTSVQNCTVTETDVTAGTVYLSLTTAQGAAAVADVFVEGYPI